MYVCTLYVCMYVCMYVCVEYTFITVAQAIDTASVHDVIDHNLISFDT